MNARLRLLAALGLASVSSALACADLLGFQDLSRPDGAVDGGGDAANDAGDAGDGGGCTQRTVDDAHGVFVTLNGTDTSTCGSRTEPCLTVQTGVDQAKLLGRSIVYVARGTYVESIQLAAGITIEGGWDTASTTWIPACDTTEISAVKLTMPASSNVTVTANFTGSAGLRLLSVLGKTSAQPGESVYGIFAVGASLTLDRISVDVGSAGDGVTGATGDAGATGGTDCNAGDAAPGASPGHTGEGAAAGTFGESGYVPASGGAGSADGGAGQPGACSISSSCITDCNTCKAVCVNALAGCGGAPGLGGAGGSGGGSSVAVYGWNATIEVLGGAYQSGNGGTGGNGGSGGSGGNGGAGDVKNATCLDLCSDAGCATVGNQSPQIGATGGQGAAGGQGGGGAGGSSYVIYNGGDAGSVSMSGSPTIVVGDAGAGGVVGGAAGNAAAQAP